MFFHEDVNICSVLVVSVTKSPKPETAFLQCTKNKASLPTLTTAILFGLKKNYFYSFNLHVYSEVNAFFFTC